MKLYRPSSEQLTREFAHYRKIVESTYSGLTAQQAYDLAYYDNLETFDPLGRCQYYRGTDQRDYFIPQLQQCLELLPDPARIGDFGAGDGQTTAMALNGFNRRAVIDIVEPSPSIKAYEAYIAKSKNLSLGFSMQLSIGAPNAAGVLQALPDNSLDIALCIHALYFFELVSGIQFMYKKLKPGAALFIVFADETRSTTGRVIAAYFNSIGRNDVAAEHMAIFRNRLQLLGSDSVADISTIINANFGHVPHITVQDAPSRFYADKFGNLAGFGLLSGLPFLDAPDKSQRATPDVFDTAKVLSGLAAFRDKPEEFDLGIVDDLANPRHGMWTSTQPQKIVTITKPRG